jgi:hypothetical protein
MHAVEMATELTCSLPAQMDQASCTSTRAPSLCLFATAPDAAARCLVVVTAQAVVLCQQPVILALQPLGPRGERSARSCQERLAAVCARNDHSKMNALRMTQQAAQTRSAQAHTQKQGP